MRKQSDGCPARQVLVKAEALAKRPNTRFVVATRTDLPEAPYVWYVCRGEEQTGS